MMNTLAFRISQFGSLPAIAYSIFVEWNSAKASNLAVERAASALSKNHVKGAKAHVAIDENENHYDMMLDVANSVMQARGYGLCVLSMFVREIAFFSGGTSPNYTAMDFGRSR